MQHYCTYFDQRFLLRGLTLYESLRAHANPFTLHVLCLDTPTYDFLVRQNLPRVELLQLQSLEQEDQQLQEARKNRKLLEYYFTLTPTLLQILFKNNPGMEMLTYLDADLYFLHSPAPLFNEMEGASIGIIEHRYNPNQQEWADKVGRFNVGWVSFRNDENSKACIAWWRERCLEATPSEPLDGKYGDQKYLDPWPEKFKGVKILSHPGANLAYWNIRTHSYSVKKRKLLIDEHPLLFYHCSGLANVGMSVYSTRAEPRSPEDGKLLAKFIFKPYVKRLYEARKRYGVPWSLSISGLRENKHTFQWFRTSWFLFRTWPHILREINRGAMFRLK